MNKKSLKEKIVSAVVWLALLAIIYFVIGIFLITDGLGFNSEKVYELLKDTLTLTAAFLAPVAAFVLFSDWREQYFQTKIEKDAQCIYEDVVNYQTLLHKLERLIQRNELNDVQYQKLIDHRGDLRAVSEELKRKIFGFDAQSEYKSDSGLIFHQKSKDIYRNLDGAAGGVRTLITGLKKEGNGEKYVQETPDFINVLFSDIYDNLDELSENMIFLTAYKSKVKAKLK